MPTVWNKLTAHLSTWFGDEKSSHLRPSCSLSALNQKNLKVVRSSKSSENLHRINQNALIQPINNRVGSAKESSKSDKRNSKSSSVLSNTLLVFKRGHKSRKKQHENEISTQMPSHENEQYHDVLANVFPMSMSWHNDISNGQTIFADAEVAGEFYEAPYENVTPTKPKRSRSITTMHHTVSHSAAEPFDRIDARHSHGFRTPQSSTAFKCKQTIDANFLSFAHKVEHPVTNSDVMYRRLELLGQGSYASVYKSENRFDGSVVALKEIKLQPQEGLPFTAIREVSLLRGLKHANIVRLISIIHQPHSLILVFEYVKTDLSKFMTNYPDGLNNFMTRIFLFQLLRGLNFCHERKILHRDIKPQNLLISENGELKLADFGLARAKSVPCRTFSHDVVTLWYRPPDVLLGSTQYSTSVDMWGVGCIFAEMATGLPLFPGINDVADQLDKIFSIRGPPNPSTWPEVRELSNYKIYRFSSYFELSWRKVHPILGKLPDNGDLLLSKLLQLNPRERIPASTAMLHPYFSSLPPKIHLLKPTESVISVISGRNFL
uniref:cyclin-dependent kinase n=1 Tax=Acrobeloides nanus TaxID=290746 RepID=A0A914CT40_9BILA